MDKIIVTMVGLGHSQKGEFMRAHKSLVIISIVLFLTASCAGRQGRPIMVQQYGDDKKSCRALEMDMNNTQREMNRMLGKQSKKSSSNTGLIVVGAILFWPALFFVDLNDSEEEEYEAYRQRYNHLAIVAIDKECGDEEAFELAPSLDELQERAREEKKRLREEKRKKRQEQYRAKRQRAKEAREAKKREAENPLEGVRESAESTPLQKETETVAAPVNEKDSVVDASLPQS